MNCPNCGATATASGRTARCGNCGARFVVSDDAHSPSKSVLADLIDGKWEEPPPTYRLYTLGSIVIGTFCASFLGGLFLASRNLKALGHTRSARKCLWIGILGTAVFLFGIVLLPEDLPVPDSLFHAAQVGIVGAYVSHSQGHEIKRHIGLGGPVYSKWRALGIGLGLMMPLLVMLFAVALFVMPPD